MVGMRFVHQTLPQRVVFASGASPAAVASEIEVVKSASQSADVELFLAVDTGGTKTSACLVDFSESKGSRVIGRGQGFGALWGGCHRKGSLPPLTPHESG